MAGLSADDIEFAELHDCFTIAEIIAMEDLGFVETGPGRPVSRRRATRGVAGKAGERERRTEVERTSGGRNRGGADLRRGAAACAVRQGSGSWRGTH